MTALHAHEIRPNEIDLGAEDAAPRGRTADLPIDIFQFEEIPYSLSAFAGRLNP